MATLHENYQTGYNGTYSTYGARWHGQSFTTTSAHSVTSVKCYAYKNGSPGTVTVEIYATSGGLPTGSALTSGTFNGNSIGDGIGNIGWVETTLTEYSLSNSTQYAIVYHLGGDDANDIRLGRNTSTASYDGGAELYSTDSGSTWTDVSTFDEYFEVWGNDPASGPANLKTYNTNAKANIKTINTNLIANVKSLDTNV